jgi:hypothetical protein
LGAAWDVALGMLRDPAFDFVVLDELNIALKYGYVSLPDVLAALRARPVRQHVVVTCLGKPERRTGDGRGRGQPARDSRRRRVLSWAMEGAAAARRGCRAA